MEKFSDLEKRHLTLGKAMLLADGGKMFSLDMYAVGSLKRSMAHCKGFATLIATKNLTCAGGILRMQLDTLLRFYAAFLVSNPHEFAHQIICGTKRVDDFTDRAGNRLKDGFLKKELSKQHPWIESVYNETSGYVHFSKKHIFSAFGAVSDEDRSVEFFISSEDLEHAQEFHGEAIAAFIHITHIFLDHIEGWVFTKDNPTLVKELVSKGIQQVPVTT